MHSLVITIKNSYAMQAENYFNDGKSKKNVSPSPCVCIKMCNEWQNRGKIHTMEREIAKYYAMSRKKLSIRNVQQQYMFYIYVLDYFE
jgi:hypothetical protein